MKDVGKSMPGFPEGRSLPKKGTTPPAGKMPSAGVKKTGKR